MKEGGAVYIEVRELDLTVARMTPIQRLYISTQDPPTKVSFALDLSTWLLAFVLAGCGWVVVLAALKVGRWLFAS